MNYSFRLYDDTKGIYIDEDGKKFYFPSLTWKKARDKDYFLYLEDRRIAMLSRVRANQGWYILPNPFNAFPEPVVNDGDPHNDEKFNRINSWVGPFVNRHVAMEYCLWTLGYIKSMGM
jgi:hypothetical protein